MIYYERYYRENDLGNGSTIDNIAEVEGRIVYNFKGMISKRLIEKITYK